MTGWGSHIEDPTAAGMWCQEKEFHVNIVVLEMVQLTLNAFLHRILGELFVFMSDNATPVAISEKAKGGGVLFQG